MDGISEETKVSIAVSSRFPGFRFSPTDEELITYYLRKKVDGFDKCVEVIPEIQICDQEPWDLPAKSIIHSDSEWFFFSSRGRKYPNGSQSKRATELGYWKATGKERNVKSGANIIGTKRTLVFHIGRAPKGERTEWIMHEYCMKEKSQDSMVVCRLRKNIEFHLHDSPNQASRSQRQVSDSQRDDGGPDHNIDHMQNYTGIDGNMDDFDGNPGHSGNYGRCDGNIDNAGTSGGRKAIDDRSKEFNSNIDNTGTSGGRKAIDDHSKEFNSSYNSHSIEQNDLPSESDPKLSGGVTLICPPQTDFGNVEDCYAEILEDDIIDLDESSLFATSQHKPMIARESEALRKSQKQVQETMTQTLPVQDKMTADSWNPHAEALRTTKASDDAKKVKPENKEQSPKCMIDVFSCARPCIRWPVSLLVVILVITLVYFYLY